MNKKLITIVLSMTLLLSGCGTISNTTTKTMTEEEQSYYSRISVVDDKTKYEEVIAKLIIGDTLSDEDKDISIISSISISDSVLSISSSEFNWFNGSIYVKVNDTYIYRFQLNTDKQIESYIKYELEA